MHRMDILTEGPRSDGDGEWLLYWTHRHTQVPGGFLPLLDEWADIDRREQALGIERDTPILIDPECRITEQTRPPSMDRCNPACANVARTDSQIRRLRTEIANLTEEASSPLTPTPLRERLSQRITALQRIADRHEQTKIVPAHPERPPSR